MQKDTESSNDEIVIDDEQAYSETQEHSDIQGASIDTATGEKADARISEQRVKNIFSKIAHRYNIYNTLTSFGIDRLWRKSLISLSNMRSNSYVLDLAAGTGDVSFEACRQIRPVHIEITDFMPEMLNVAKERAKAGANKHVPVSFNIVDAQDIPYPDNHFDVITISFGIRNIPNRELALSEIYRVLKPGGTFACLEFSKPQYKILEKLYDVYLKSIIPFWGWVLTKKKEDFVYLANSIKAFPDQTAFANMMQEAGFRRVSFVNKTGGIAAIHTGKK